MWVGGGNESWNNVALWTIGGVQATSYPGQLSNADTVIINGRNLVVNVAGIILENLIINPGTPSAFLTSNPITTTNTTLNGVLSNGSIDTTNLTVTPGGEATNYIRMNGSPVTIPSFPGTLTIATMTGGDYGNINAGSRNVTLTVPGSLNTAIDIGNISTTGTVTINVTGNDNDITMKDISSVGNVLVNITGTNNTVRIGDITSNGTVTIDAGLGNNINVDSSVPPPIGTGVGNGTVTVGGTSLVVGWGPDPIISGIGVYTYIDLDVPAYDDVDGVYTIDTATYTGINNIYIHNVGNIGNRSFTFNAPNGYIEIRGSYQTTGTITLSPSSAANRGLRLNGANINLITSTSAFHAPVPITLIGISNTITAGNKTLGHITGNGSDLILNSGPNTIIGGTGIGILTLNGETFFGPVAPDPSVLIEIATLSSTMSNIHFRCSLRSLNTQHYAGNIILHTDVELHGTVQITNINSGSHGLHIIGSASFSGGGANTLTVRELQVSGATTISGGNKTIVTTGGQSYNGSVVLETNVNFSAPSGQMINFQNIVNSDGTPRDLTITNANVTFGGNVGVVSNLGRINVTGGGTATTGSASPIVIVTSATGIGQDYGGNVILGNNTHFVTDSGSVRFGGTVNGNFGLNFSAASVEFNGTVGTDATSGNILASISSPSGIIFNAGSAGIFTSGDQSYGGTITFNGTNAKTLTSTEDSISTTVAITNNSTAALTINAQNNITIGAGGISNGSNSLTFNATAGNIVINGPLSNINVLTLNTLNPTAGNITINSSMTVNITRAVFNAPNGEVSIPSGVTITVQSANGHTGNNNPESGAIYINTPTLNVPGTTGTIGSTNTNGVVCLEMNPISHGGRIIRPCWHETIPKDRNIHYGVDSNVGTVYNSAANYYFVDSSLGWGTDFTLEVDPDFHILVSDVGPSPAARNRNLTVKVGPTPATDYIRFSHYESNGTLTIDPGSGKIVIFESLDLTASGSFNTNGIPLELQNSSSIRAGTIVIDGGLVNSTENLTLHGNATLTRAPTGILDLVINGNITFGPSAAETPMPTIGATSIVISAGNTATIRTNITTTGSQTYNGPVVFSGFADNPITLTSVNSNITASGIVSRGTGYTGDVTLNASSGITMDNAGNTLGGTLSLNINQGTPPANADIQFRTTGNITLSAVNNSNNGSINILQSGTLGITLLSSTNGNINLGLSAAVMVGAVTQTGTITANALTIDSSAGITLGANNSVGTFLVNRAGGAVVFNNAGALGVNGVSNVGANNITITTTTPTGELSTTSSITTTGVVTLQSTASNIIINNDISSSQLALIAGPNVTTAVGDVTITAAAGINASFNNSTHNINTNSAIYVRAVNLNITEPGSGSINPGTNAGFLCVCGVTNKASVNTARITGARICIVLDYHIIYGPDIPPDLVGLPEYHHIDSANPVNFPGIFDGTNITASENRNIFIVNVGNQTGDRSFSTSGSGFIEFRGAYTSAGTLALNPGTTGVQFAGAQIDLTAATAAGSSVIINTLTLTAAGTGNSIRARAINLGFVTGNGHDLTLTGTGSGTLPTHADVIILGHTPDSAARIGNLQVNGNVVFGAGLAFPPTEHVNAVNVNVTGSSYLRSFVQTTEDQTYEGTILLYSTAPADAFRVLQGRTITVNAVDGGEGVGCELRIQGNAVFRSSSFTNLRRLQVLANPNITGSGTTRIISAGITTTGTTADNGQTYSGAVTLEFPAVNLTTGAAAAVVAFNSTVNSDAVETPRALTITTGNVTFANTVGATAPLASLTVTAGLTTINQLALAPTAFNITTTGNQSYAAVTFLGAANKTFVSNTGSITMNGIVQKPVGTNIIIRANQGISMNNAGNSLGGTGTVTLQNQGAMATPLVPIPAGNVVLRNSNTDLRLTIVNNGIGSTTVNQTGGNLLISGITVNGALAEANNAVSITASGTITVGGAIGANNDAERCGLVTLRSDNENVVINSNIYAVRLSIHANTNPPTPPSPPVFGRVEVANSATINVSSRNNHDSGSGDGREAAIHIEAHTFFAASGGSGSIFPGPRNPSPPGQMCVHVSFFRHNNKVDQNRYHWCEGGGFHIVYGPVNVFEGTPDWEDYYQWLDSNDYDDPLVTGYSNFHIYIVDVNQATSPTTYDRSMTFRTFGIGSIEFIGNNELTGTTLTLTPGPTGGVVFNSTDANVILDRGSNAFTPSAITLTGTGSNNVILRAESITIADAITGNNNNLILEAATGNVTINHAIANSLRSLTVNALNNTAGTININQNVQTGQNQTYNGPVVINSNRILAGSGAASTVEFNGTVNGDNNSRTLAIDNANVIFNEPVGAGAGLQTITVLGTAEPAGITTINTTNITTAGAANAQHYHGPVVLGDNVIFTGAGLATTIRFDSTVNGDGVVPRSLTAVNGYLWFGGQVGGDESLASIENSTTGALGNNRVDARITTTGDQTYTGPLVIGGAAVFEADAGSMIAFGNTINSADATARSLVIENANTEFNNNVGTVPLNPISSVSVEGGGSARIFTNITTTNDQDYGIVILSGASGTTRNLTGQNVTMGAITGNDNNLRVDGNAVLNGASNIGIDNLNVTGTTSIEGTVALTHTGVYTQGGVINVDGIFNQNGAGTVLLQAPANTVTLETAASQISFVSQVEISSNVTFVSTAAGGTVELLAGIEDNNFSLIFDGGTEAAPLVFNQASGLLGNVLIRRNRFVNVNTGAVVRQKNGSSLTLEGESALNADDAATLETSAGSWYVGGAGTVGAFDGINGSLILGVNSRLITGSLNLNTNTFTITNAGRAFVGARGSDVSISNVVISDYMELVFEMLGNGPAALQRVQTLTATRVLGRLHVRPGSQTNLNSNLEIHGEVVIQYETVSGSSLGILNAGTHSIVIKAGLTETKNLNGTDTSVRVGRWRVENAPGNFNPMAYPAGSAFRQDPALGASVSFEKMASADLNVFFEIIGNTVWQRFICEEQIGVTIQFSTDPHQHFFLHVFSVKVTGSNVDEERVMLTRYLDPSQSTWLYYYHDSGIVPPARGLPQNPTQRERFWNFNFVTNTALVTAGIAQFDLEHVMVYFSYSNDLRVIEDEAAVWAFPFYTPGSLRSYFNHNWVPAVTRTIIYSFAEDGSGNGRVDRIRVQTTLNLNGDFRGFVVRVEGYEINTDEGEEEIGGSLGGGFRRVDRAGVSGGHGDSFYIYLREGLNLYDGRTITWWVVDNPHLRDVVRHSSVHADETIKYNTINTIPPRVSHALTLPGHNQTFVQMSQPVAVYDGSSGSISGDPNRFTTGDHMNSALSTASRPSHGNILDYPLNNDPAYTLVPGELGNSGVTSYMLSLNNAPGISDLASLPPIGAAISTEYFELNGLYNMAVRALDWSDPYFEDGYPPPKYPTNWNYSGYAPYKGNSHLTDSNLYTDEDTGLKNIIFVPPYQVLTPAMVAALATGGSVVPGDFATSNTRRRITDVLVSLAPSANDSENYFAWPVWARSLDDSRYDNDERIDFTDPDNIVFWNTSTMSMGIIWHFDGSAYLEARSILESGSLGIALQVRVNSAHLSGYSGLDLRYGINVPVDFRNPASMALRGGRSTGGLWLPGTGASISSIVPRFYTTFGTASQSAANPLFLYTIDVPSANEQKFEFLLRLNGTGGDPNLFVARLDAPPGSIPANWYTLVRPFHFNIQDMQISRGGVTIMNNVINSDNREVTYLRYNLVRPGRVTIQVHTLDGTLVRSIKRNEHHNAGEYTVGWDGSNNSGRPVARGMYFIRVVGPDMDEIRKVMVVR